MVHDQQSVGRFQQILRRRQTEKRRTLFHQLLIIRTDITRTVRRQTFAQIAENAFALTLKIFRGPLQRVVHVFRQTG